MAPPEADQKSLPDDDASLASLASLATVSELPQVFGRYLLLRRLSRGGMGEIFLAKLGEIQGFEKPVIIKKILPHLSADQEFVKRFIDEAQVAIKLNHANVAAVYEVGKVDGDYFLALEYVEGRDVRRLLQRCREERFRLPPDLCLYIGRELASGLGYAHRRTDSSGRTLALVHCDISPPNVMVSFEGEVKIIDFGIAKSAIRIAGSNPNIGFGKFGYMAPEQLIRGGVVDRRTDIYAAGVVLYELLTGERLFQFPEGADYKEIARIVARGEFVPPSVRSPGLDPSLDVIVCKALATKADARYQTAEEFRDALQSKLSQMNPTISADQLAHLVRELFADEIEDERALVASTKDFDISEFRDELTGSLHHTVTFARAGLLGRRGQREMSNPPRTSMTPAPTRRRRWGTAALMALGASVTVSVLLMVAAVRWVIAGHDPAPLKPRVATGSAMGAHLSGTPGAARPTTSPAGQPEVRELPPTQATVVAHGPVNAAPADSSSLPAHDKVLRHPRRGVDSARQGAAGDATHPASASGSKLPRPGHPASPGSDSAGRNSAPDTAEDRTHPPDRPTDDGVKGKFSSTKREYDSFRREYGPRLESEWNAIIQEATYGKPTDKYGHINSMLDSLRRDMAKIRTGG